MEIIFLDELAEKSKIGEKRSVIKAFLRGVDQASFVLKENPELIFSQVYNRLQWQAEQEKILKEKIEFERSKFKRPWFRLLTRPAGSSALIRTFTGHTYYVEACAFSPDGKRIVSSSWDKTLKLWNSETGEELNTLRGHTHSVHACAFSPDGKRIVLGDLMGQVLLLSLEYIEIYPAIVTAYQESGKLFFRCPYCLNTNQIEESLLDKEVLCSACGQKNKLNPFAITIHKFKHKL